jgi:aryl-alcohol dehydrogenase-like predicted oxidoreductase
VFTKCGLEWDANGDVRRNISRDRIRRECEDSLRRLNVDVIDLYQIHWPTNGPGEIEEAWETMESLRTEGKVRWIGVSNFDARQLERAHAIAPVTSLQPPYSLLRRGIEEEVLPWCAEHGVGVIVYAPMYSGLLTGAMTRERAASLPADDWRSRNREFQEPLLSRNLELVERLREAGEPLGRSPGEMAIAWTLRRPEVTAAIVGGRNAGQVDGIVGALEVPAMDWSELERLESPD